jgi:hypothetical protein
MFVFRSAVLLFIFLLVRDFSVQKCTAELSVYGNEIKGFEPYYGEYLCGVNSAYIVCKELEVNNFKYKNILSHFPEVHKRGVSLGQLKEFFQKKGLNTDLTWRSEEQIAQEGTNVFALVLYKGKPMSHIVCKRALGDGRIQSFDGFSFSEKANEFSNTQEATLLVYKEGICDWKFIKYFLWFIITFVLLFVSIHTTSKIIEKKKGGAQ